MTVSVFMLSLFIDLVNGFKISEDEVNKLMDCQMDEVAEKNPEFLRFLINKTLVNSTDLTGFISITHALPAQI